MTKRIILAILTVLLLFSSALAHPGDTDSKGGHYNRSTGEYHYHHGYPEHQHPNGVCPYANSLASSDDTSDNSGGYEGIDWEGAHATAKRLDSEYRSGYQTGYSYGNANGRKSGYEDGYAKGKAAGQAEGYNNGYEEGESAGYKNASKDYTKQINYIGLGVGIALIIIILHIVHCHKKIKDAVKSMRAAEDRSRWLGEALNQEVAHSTELETQLLELKTQNAFLQQKLEQPDQLPESVPKALPQPEQMAQPERVKKLASFGDWPKSIHGSEKQFKKFMRAETQPLKLLNYEDGTARIKGTSGEVYTTTLRSCTCPDFTVNEHGGAPCKHIYFLALQRKLPVADIFEDYIKQ